MGVSAVSAAVLGLQENTQHRNLLSTFPLLCLLQGAIINVPLRASQGAGKASHITPPFHGQMSSAPPWLLWLRAQADGCLEGSVAHQTSGTEDPWPLASNLPPTSKTLHSLPKRKSLQTKLIKEQLKDTKLLWLFQWIQHPGLQLHVKYPEENSSSAGIQEIIIILQIRSHCFPSSELTGLQEFELSVTLEPVMCLADACLGSDEVLQRHMMPEEGLKSHQAVRKKK